MTLHSAKELMAIAKLLGAIERFQSDSSHSLILTGTLNVLDAYKDLETGQLRVSVEGPYYLPTAEEPKENE
jgi:hypothetical protein